LVAVAFVVVRFSINPVVAERNSAKRLVEVASSTVREVIVVVARVEVP
jgi:hypothetical protein